MRTCTHDARLTDAAHHHVSAPDQSANGNDLGRNSLAGCAPEPAAGALSPSATPAAYGAMSRADVAAYAEKRLAQGANWKQIAAELGGPYNSIRVRCNNAGVFRRRGLVWSAERTQQAAKRAAETSIATAAAEFGVTAKSLEMALQRRGISVARIRAKTIAAPAWAEAAGLADEYRMLVVLLKSEEAAASVCRKKKRAMQDAR